MSLINIQKLTFAYPGTYDDIFENVDLALDTDWKLGLIGRNGRGKSTLLNLLMGKYEYSGNISSSVIFEYFPYEIENRDDTVEAVIEKAAPDAETWRVRRELALLGIDEDIYWRPFSTLSGGEQTKVMIALMFANDGRFMLIDEPTNHIDRETRGAIKEYLGSKKGYILVSHDRALLDSCTDHILSINRNNIELTAGNYSVWEESFRRQQEFELRENDRLEKDIARLRQGAARAGRWADKVENTKLHENAFDKGYIGHQSAKMMKRAKSLENRQNKAAEEKSKLLKNVEKQEDLKLFSEPHHASVLAELKDVAVTYNGRAVNRPVSFRVGAGERICLRGGNGAGKSSIMKLLKGDGLSYDGEFLRASRLNVSYVSQDTTLLKGSFDDFVNVSGIDKTQFLTILRKFDFERKEFEKDISGLSEGQKKKILIARSLCDRANLYLWDEPLNYIDIYSRVQLEDLILRYEPTMVFIEHDEYFTEKIATRIIEIEKAADRS